MPAITAPDTLPCPQASTVSPEERRLMSEGASGPRELRTIEQDERQYQTLNWTLTEEQADVFANWWRNDLVFGGAWWSAPGTWPTPERGMVKVRRFITNPSWTQYAGRGVWRLSIACEVRGSTLLPQLPPVLPVVWDDDFEDTVGVSLFDHVQSMSFNGSEWSAFGDGLEPRIRAGGKVGADPASTTPGRSGAQTYFGPNPDTSQAIPLLPGWQFSVDATLFSLTAPSFDEAAWSSLYLFLTSTQTLQLTYMPALVNEEATVRVHTSTPLATNDFPVSAGSVSVRVQFNLDSYVVFINGAAQVEVPYEPDYLPRPRFLWFLIGYDYIQPSGPARAGGTMTFDNMTFRGMIDA